LLSMIILNMADKSSHLFSWTVVSTCSLFICSMVDNSSITYKTLNKNLNLKNKIFNENYTYLRFPSAKNSLSSIFKKINILVLFQLNWFFSPVTIWKLDIPKFLEMSQFQSKCIL
jgi:hypothetical protein